MGVVLSDGSTVRDFVNDKTQFKKRVDESFAVLDLNKDGVLSRVELRKAFETMRLIETHFGIDEATTPEQLTKLYDSIFDKFDCDGSGTVELESEGGDEEIHACYCRWAGVIPYSDGSRGRR